MNMNQLTKISPFLRNFSRHLIKLESIGKVSIKYLPVRCIAISINKLNPDNVRARRGMPEEEIWQRQKQEHAQHDWNNFSKVMWQLAGVSALFLGFIIYLCYTKSVFVAMGVDADRLCLPEHEELHPDKAD